MIKVFLCDDIEEILTYFKGVIDDAEDMTVVGTAKSKSEAVSKVIETQPDIVIMDIQMETETAGIEATRKIYEQCPDTKIIMLTVHNDNDLIVRSYLAGAVDYMTKLSRPKYIAEEIRKIYNEEILIGSTIAAHIRDEFEKTKKIQDSLLYIINKWSTLTNAEIDIIKMLAEGKTRKEIMRLKYLEMSTVKTHINNILKKFDYPNTNSLIQHLKQIGIIQLLYKDDNGSKSPL